MKNLINQDVSFGFTKLTRKFMAKYIEIMYEDAAEYTDESIMREYNYLRDSGNLHELFEGYGMAALANKIIKNYLSNMYEDAADYSDESIEREYKYIKDQGSLHDLFLCDWLFSEEFFTHNWLN